MKMQKIGTAISKFGGRNLLKVKKASPEILMATGLLGIGGTIYLACSATLKVEDLLAEHEDKKDKINSVWEKVKDGEVPLDDYNYQDKKRDLTVTYVQTGVNFLKLYGPAITLGALSVTCILSANNIMRKRNVALAAAYKAVEEGFNSYRQRVIEEFGEEKDYMYRNGLRSEVVTEEETDADGKKKKVKKTVMKHDPVGANQYSKIFDETNKNWSKNAEYNLMFLQTQQNYFNDLLNMRKHVFLNEVYDALGMERTSAGSVVGWIFGKGDGYVDFGIFDVNDERARAFVNGYESAIRLDFNVHGVIYDEI